MNTTRSATTWRDLAGVPRPAGATHVGEWDDPRPTDVPSRYFTGGSWVVVPEPPNIKHPDITVQVSGTQYSNGGTARFVNVSEGQYEALVEMSSTRARHLARALIAAADEVDQMASQGADS